MKALAISEDLRRAKLAEQLSSLLTEWQKTLRLQDWDVKVKLVRQFELATNKVGNCTWTIYNKTAFIKVLDPGDHHQDCVWPYDIEETLVHELIHLHFAAMTKSEPHWLEDVCLEQAVESLTQACLSLKRANV